MAPHSCPRPAAVAPRSSLLLAPSPAAAPLSCLAAASPSRGTDKSVAPELFFLRRKLSLVRARTDGSGSGAAAAEASTVGDNLEGEESGGGEQPPHVNPKIEKELKKAVQKTAATFAPRASTKTKNPAVPGSALYTIFEVQGYVSMLNKFLLFCQTIVLLEQLDMLSIPSLRACDCSNKEKEALNYLFLLIPLINVIIPFFVKSFAVVWSADTVAFFVMYAWKLGWLQSSE
ncbi:hypothetical protein PVAP13_3KG260400 [Panicum virgatum]|uniref:Uncharacterized protein n=1 Tax=Panicum virgatum TaxID=38727 RepID=A0A8T0V439_PANVG|nr:hypothetical protein PVAP13_3KG260400 [Panicum virgatum]